jgi:hypothetical protein
MNRLRTTIDATEEQNSTLFFVLGCVSVAGRARALVETGVHRSRTEEAEDGPAELVILGALRFVHRIEALLATAGERIEQPRRESNDVFPSFRELRW